MRRGRRRVEFPARRRRRRATPFVALTVPSLVITLVLPALEWYTLGPGRYRPVAELLANLDAALAMYLALAVPFGLAGLAATAGPRRHPFPTLVGWLTTMALTGTLFVSAVGGLEAAQSVRRYRLARVAEQARPVILAIRQFQADHGRPPAELTELIPDYLPAPVRPNARRYREFGYNASPNVTGSPADRPAWALLLHCFWGLSYDVFAYWPTEQYPPLCYGGTTERIGRWIYVHE